jgi:spermidine/putrescine-binding protein
MWRKSAGILLIIMSLLVGGCNAQPVATPTPVVDEIVLASWPEDIPQTVMDAFTAETGIRVRYTTYGDQQMAAQTLQAEYVYDVVNMNSEQVAILRAANSLAPPGSQLAAESAQYLAQLS